MFLFALNGVKPNDTKVKAVHKSFFLSLNLFKTSTVSWDFQSHFFYQPYSGSCKAIK